MKESREILHDYVSDMLAVNKHFLEVLDWQISDNRLKDYPEALHLSNKIKETLRSHMPVLERYIEKLDVKKGQTALKAAAVKVSGVSAGIYNLMRREDSVMRNQRDNYTALNMTAISYTMLHTTSLVHHDSELEALTLKCLKEVTPLIVETSRVIPAVVVKELLREGKAADPLVIQKAIDNTQQAWDHEVTGR